MASLGSPLNLPKTKEKCPIVFLYEEINLIRCQKGIVSHFLFLLFSGRIQELTALYYVDGAKVILNDEIGMRKKSFGIDMLNNSLNYLQILQFKVFDLKQGKDELSYGVYMVTRNEDNTIDFSEHHIINKWKNDRIQLHNHTIINT